MAEELLEQVFKEDSDQILHAGREKSSNDRGTLPDASEGTCPRKLPEVSERTRTELSEESSPRKLSEEFSKFSEEVSKLSDVPHCPKHWSLEPIFDEAFEKKSTYGRGLGLESGGYVREDPDLAKDRRFMSRGRDIHAMIPTLSDGHRDNHAPKPSRSKDHREPKLHGNILSMRRPSLKPPWHILVCILRTQAARAPVDGRPWPPSPVLKEVVPNLDPTLSRFSTWTHREHPKILGLSSTKSGQDMIASYPLDHANPSHQSCSRINHTDHAINQAILIYVDISLCSRFGIYVKIS